MIIEKIDFLLKDGTPATIRSATSGNKVKEWGITS
jgi:hypothetical protein